MPQVRTRQLDHPDTLTIETSGQPFDQKTATDIRALVAKSLNERGHRLVAHDELRRAPGIASGWLRMDAFLMSGGFPCGELSLLEAPAGLGATTLWLDTAVAAQKNGHRVAWVNALAKSQPADVNTSNSTEHTSALHPTTALQRGVDLKRLLFVDLPRESDGLKKRLWILKEILATRLFSLVGCDLGDVPLPLRQGRSLLMQARRSDAAVILIARTPSTSHDSYHLNAISNLRTLASVAVEFQEDRCRILRAPHRPVPQTLERRNRHVEFISGRTIDLRFVLAEKPASEPAPHCDNRDVAGSAKSSTCD